MRKIILASSSPRRKQLLNQLIGNNFEIKPSSYKENNNLNLKPVNLVLHHSLQKAIDVAKDLKEGIVISADTLVFYKNKVLGKPFTEEKAEEMLKKLSNKNIEVITGLAVIDIENKKEIQDYEITKIKIKKLTEKEIKDYIKTKEPLDRAGAFAIQEKGAIFIEKIKGDYLGAVGLPLFKLNKILVSLGISIFDYTS